MVESRFLAHLSTQPPLSLESTGRKITNSIFIITKTSTAGDNKVVSYGGFELLQLLCLKPPFQGSVRFGNTSEQSIVPDWLYSIKRDGRIFFLFPLGNTSSKTCKISVPPSGLSLEQNKGTSWRKEKLILWVYLGCCFLRERFILTRPPLHSQSCARELGAVTLPRRV